MQEKTGCLPVPDDLRLAICAVPQGTKLSEARFLHKCKIHVWDCTEATKKIQKFTSTNTKHSSQCSKTQPCFSKNTFAIYFIPLVLVCALQTAHPSSAVQKADAEQVQTSYFLEV